MIGGLVLLLMISSLPGLLEASPPPKSLVKPTCNHFNCGALIIPYPFGMGEACYANSWYSISCNHSKPFLNHPGLNLEVLNITLLGYPTVTVNSPISSFCKNTEEKMTETKASIDLNQSPFSFSMFHNVFVVLGCGSASLMDQFKVVMAGCGSICPSVSVDDKDCYGIKCCQTTIRPKNSYFLDNYSVSFTTESDKTGCVTHALVVGRGWFSSNFSSQTVLGVGYAPLVLSWRLEEDDGYAGNRCRRSYYDNGTSPFYAFGCTCGWKKEGNPHLLDGCHGTLLS